MASYHHLPDIHATSRILSSLLKPSGSLLIADILNEPVASFSDQPELLEKYKDIVVHTNGFTEDKIRENIGQAGLQEFNFRVVTSASLHGRTVKFFLARGIKPDVSGLDERMIIEVFIVISRKLLRSNWCSNCTNAMMNAQLPIVHGPFKTCECAIVHCNDIYRLLKLPRCYSSNVTFSNLIPELHLFRAFTASNTFVVSFIFSDSGM